VSDFLLGTLDPLGQVLSYDGFDRPNTAQLVTVLSDGTYAATQVLQQSALPRKRASLRVLTYTQADVDYLRTAYDARSVLSFTDCDGLPPDVQILEFIAERGQVGRRFFNMTLIEAT